MPSGVAAYDLPTIWGTSLVPELIDDEKAHILWRTNDDLLVEEVFIAPHLVLRNGSSDHDRAEVRRLEREYPASAGADTAGWLDTKDPAASPAGVFSNIALRHGFANPDGIEQCLREFAKIRGADWARQMLASYIERP